MFISCSFARCHSAHLRRFVCNKPRPPLDLSLYLVTHRASVSSDDIFVSKVLRGVEGGVTCVQLRDEGDDCRSLIRMAEKLKRLLTPLKVPLIINDRVDIAQAIGAEGVHLGQKDIPPLVARRILGPRAIIGLSVDTWDNVIEAQDLDVDYLGVSQLFGSKVTKPCNRDPWGLENLKKIRSVSKHRLLPIGGINSSNLVSVCQILSVRPENDGIAMVGELWRADDPLLAAKKISALIKEANYV